MHLRGITRLCLLVCLTLAMSTYRAEAACNLIPVASLTFPSTTGSVETPITAPGETVRLVVDPACDGSPGFESVPASNTVTVQFQPPGGGGTTDVIIDPADVTVGDCTLPGGRCGTLSFVMPATTSVLPPYGLAGPARITVTDLAVTTVAQVDDLFVPTSGCDRFPEKVFERFTVLPPPSNFAQLEAGMQTEVLATVDGSGALLVPLDYWGGGVDAVLAETPGAPVAIFLEGSADIPALGAGDPESISEKLAAQPSPSDFVRSFTLDGRPLPPLLRVRTDGGLYGTADAVQSVLRIASDDGSGGPTLFDLSDRLTAGKGPIVIDMFVVGVNDPVPLKNLQSSESAVAFAREETREAADLNADGDQTDFVVEVLDADTGVGTNTGMATAEVLSFAFSRPALVTNADVAAFLQAEEFENQLGLEGQDLNGDGDTGDTILRVFDRSGAQVAAGLDLDAATQPLVNGREVEVSGERVFFRAPGGLVQRLQDGVGGQNDLSGIFDVAVSPDGDHVYLSVRAQGSFTDTGLLAYARNPATGVLTFVENEPGSGTFGTVAGPRGIALSPDGGHLYMVQAGSSTYSSLVVFSRDALTGELSFVQEEHWHQPSMTGLTETLHPGDAVIVSPDGSTVYAINSSGVLAFSRDPGTGVLTLVQELLAGIDLPNWTNTIDGLAVTSDGETLVFASSTVSTLFVFDRNTTTGFLSSPPTEFVDGLGGVVGLGAAWGVVVSPDDRFVYVTAALGDAVVTFSRDLVTNQLTFERADFDGDDGIFGFVNGGQPAISPDGRRLYVPGLGLAFFDRNLLSGELTFLTTDGLLVSNEFALSPDGQHGYASRTLGVTSRTLDVVRLEASLRALDTATGLMKTEAPVARRTSVAAERALLLTPESVDGIDLNGDGDSDDEVAQLYDVAGGNDSLVPLSVAGRRVSISASLAAVTVVEADENQNSVLGEDLNGDGDMDDSVLAVQGVGDSPPPTNTGLSAVAIGALGTDVVLLTREADEDTTILNGDGDTLDDVIRIYHDATNSVTELGQSATEFVQTAQYVAYRTFEGDEGPAGVGCMPTAPLGGCDLNGDGDALDHVLRVYDRNADVVINTGRAALICAVPGCDARVPYKIKGTTVSFLTDEQEQGADLNGDTDSDDIVLTVYNIIAQSADEPDTVIDDMSSTGTNPQLELPPFPEDLVDGPILYVEVKESEVGLDVNADGMITDDRVVMIAGDNDGDGALDLFDDCVEHANADQSDLDADGLGTRCEPAEDVDGDGVANITDNCPDVYNPGQEDDDGDGVGDACDTAPFTTTTTVSTTSTTTIVTTSTTVATTTTTTSTTLPGGIAGVEAAKLIVVDKTTVAGKAKVVFVSKDGAITKGPGTSESGISVSFDFAYADGATAGGFALPAGASDGSAGWVANKESVAKYVNKQAPGGPTGAKVAVVKPAKLLKLVGKSLGDVPIDVFGAGAPSGSGVATEYAVTNGGATYRHCTTFAGASCVHKIIAGGTGAKLVCKGGVADPTCGS